MGLGSLNDAGADDIIRGLLGNANDGRTVGFRGARLEAVRNAAYERLGVTGKTSTDRRNRVLIPAKITEQQRAGNAASRATGANDAAETPKTIPTSAPIVTPGQTYTYTVRLTESEGRGKRGGRGESLLVVVTNSTPMTVGQILDRAREPDDMGPGKPRRKITSKPPKDGVVYDAELTNSEQR